MRKTYLIPAVGGRNVRRMKVGVPLAGGSGLAFLAHFCFRGPLFFVPNVRHEMRNCVQTTPNFLLRAYPRLMRTIVLCGMAVAVASLPACSSVAPSERLMPRPAVAPTVGLFLNEPEAFEGYTLFSKLHRVVGGRGDTIYLIDNQGREVHRWELRFRTPFARLLENGNLLTLAYTDQGRYLREVGRNGDILSDCTQGSPHHDFLRMPNGNVLLLSRQHKAPEEVIAAGANPEFIGPRGLVAPHIVEARITGPASCEIVWEWSAWDHLNSGL